MTKARECGDKDQRTKADAEAYVIWRRRQHLADLQPYHCRWCGWWHVGHRVPVGRRPRRVR